MTRSRGEHGVEATRFRLSGGVSRCPRCSYRGDGLPYFSRGAHMAALVGATVLTAGAMGAGGIVYYVVRKDHVICPRCGTGWGKEGRQAVGRPVADEERHELPAPAASYGGGASMRRIAASGLYVLAAILIMAGIAELELAAAVVGLSAGAGGLLLHRAANRDREERRRALIASLQLPVLQLAARTGGRLTVTQAAAELGWTLPRAEKILQSLDDGFRVSSEVTDEGLIVYEFRELAQIEGRPASEGPRLPPEPGARELPES